MSNSRSWRIGKGLLPYMALVLIHVLSGMRMEQPVVLADELGYLGNARYLSGTAHLPNMHGSQFYHFGYSLILLPAFWLFTDPIAIYKASILINALLASSIYFSLYFILESFLEVPKSTARWIAFTCSLYPPLILYSNFALSENAFVPLYAATAALFGMYVVSRSSRDALLFGVSASFLYTIHPRALPVLAIVAAYLVVLTLLKVGSKRQLLLSAAAMGGVFALTRLVNGHLKVTGWGGGGEISATKLAGRLVPGSDFPLLVERALGQLLYLTLASHGLFLVGLGVVLWLILENTASTSPLKVLSNPKTALPLFVLVTSGGVFIAACTAKLYSVHGPYGVRGADFIHGRYNEAFAVLLMALALAEYSRRRVPSRQLILAGIGVAVVTLCITAVVALEVRDALRRHDPSVPAEAVKEEILPAEVNAVAVPGVFPLVGLVGGLNLYSMSLLAMVSFLLITVTMRYTKRGGMVLLVLLFGFFALFNDRHYVSTTNAAVRPRLAFVSKLSRIGPIEAISYDAAYQNPDVFYGVQYLLPQTVFNRFDSLEREAPASEAVISGNRWRQARRLRARYAVAIGWNNALWVLPGELQSRLPDVSYEGVTLGAESKFGFQEAGFRLPEEFLGAPGRWTTGAALLRVPLEPGNPPRTLAIETLVPGRDGAQLRVLANGIELWNGRVPSDLWSKTFSLERVPLNDPLLIELRSDTSPDDPNLGIVVRGIRLMGREPADAAYEGVTLGAEPVLGFEETGFHTQERIEGEPVRWTTGTATLHVPVDPSNLPRLLEVETIAPGRDGARLRVLANGIELWNQRIPADEWSRTFSLEEVPMKDGLLVELLSDTFSPAEKYPDSPDTRRLGVAVRGIRLTAKEVP